MAYISRRGRRPMEMASKINQSHIIHQPEIQDFLKRCTLPQAADESTITQQMVPVEVPDKSPTEYIIAIDGGFTEAEIRKETPASSLTFYNFGALFFQSSILEDLKQLPFILPEDMKKLRDMQRARPFTLPTRNVSLDGRTLTHSVRLAVYEFFTNNQVDDDPPLIKALRWLLFEEYDTDKPLPEYHLSSCPHCKTTKIPIQPNEKDIFNCPNCGGELFLTDVFRLHERVDDELGAGGIISPVMGILEQMFLVHIIKIIWENRSSYLSLDKVFFVKDGPLAFFDVTSNIRKPMQALVNFLMKQPASDGSGRLGILHLVGVEKSGAFVDHADQIRKHISPGYALIPNNKYVYRYIMPGNENTPDAYGSTTYYSRKIIYKTLDENIYVLTLPTAEAYLEPKLSDLLNASNCLYHVSRLKCHMYDDALVPVALVNKLVSLADHPSRKILSVFAKDKIV
ncbi:MAG: NurA domain-containing protein [Symploca sp. SIO2D2]|nr:NurA domain-containing protein [Symploca sp. SIO2D2]